MGIFHTKVEEITTDATKNYKENQSSSNNNHIIRNNPSCNPGFDIFCGNLNNALNDRLDSNEIVLSKSSYYPRGTFTNDSMRFFTKNEREMFYMCQGENIPAIRFLTLKGVHINILDQDRTSPLHIASNSASLQMIEEIINQGAMINLPDISGWTALHIASYYKRSDVILLLLKNGANMNTRNRDGFQPVDLINRDKECGEIFYKFARHSQLKEDNLNEFEESNEEREIDEQPKRSSKVLIKKTNNKSNKLLIYNKMNNSFNNQDDIQRNNDEVGDLIKETKKEIFMNYKFIPKKHKFYLNYKSNERYNEENPFTIKKHLTTNNEKEDTLRYSTRVMHHDRMSVISRPKVFPVTSSINNLNHDRMNYHTNVPFMKGDDILGDKDEPSYEDEEEREKFKIYRTDDEDDDDSIDLDASIMKDFQINRESITSIKGNNSRNIRTINDKLANYTEGGHIINRGEDDTTTKNNTKLNESLILSEKVAICERFGVGPCRFAYNKKIFLDQEADYFITKINFTNIFFQNFRNTTEEIEDMFSFLFKADANFALLLTLNVLNLGNSFESLICAMTETIKTNQLRRNILTGSYSTVKLREAILEFYFKSEVKQRSLQSAIKKYFKGLGITNSLIELDILSKSFSEHYFPFLNNSKESNQIRSENALYYFTFTVLINDYQIWKEKETNKKIKTSVYRKLFLDMSILLKNLNEGENFDVNFIKGCFKYSNLFGYVKRESRKDITHFDKTKRQAFIIINNKSKHYYFSCFNKTMLLFKDPKMERLNKMICFPKGEFATDANKPSMTISVKSLGKKNLFVFKNKLNSIKYKKHDQIIIKVMDVVSFDLVKNDLE